MLSGDFWSWVWKEKGCQKMVLCSVQQPHSFTLVCHFILCFLACSSSTRKADHPSLDPGTSHSPRAKPLQSTHSSLPWERREWTAHGLSHCWISVHSWRSTCQRVSKAENRFHCHCQKAQTNQHPLWWGTPSPKEILGDRESACPAHLLWKQFM